ncbi:MAG TPA: sigma 54-interacting transcriptional regulator [Candidatus Krumholzibacteria bacterium]|nr:sigma 54-interacting transcriptional regulator [Candidatus Krumholzibacteria bacterium]
MRTDARSGTVAGRAGTLQDLPVDRDLWLRAQDALAAEQWEAALAGAREAIDRVAAGARHLAPVAGPGEPRVQDAILLAARCLFQLDRRSDFDVLLASAGRWTMVPEPMPELDAVRLAFALKRGEYLSVVREATMFIDAHRAALPPVIAEFLHLRGLARSHLGEPEAALEDTETAHALFRILGRERERGRSANLMGIQHLRAARFDAAELWFRRAAEVHAALGARKNLGGNRLNLGITLYKRGSLAAAANELVAARRLLRDAEAQVPLCRATIAVGCVMLLRRDLAGAAAQLHEAYETANALMLSREEALALEYLGDAALAEGQADKARRYYSRALAVGRAIAPEGDVVMEVLRRQGACLAAQGRPADAVPLLSRALQQSRRLGDRFEEGAIRRVMAEVLLEVGDLESAQRSADAGAALLEDIGAGYELGLARLVQARACLARIDAGAGDGWRDTLELAWRRALSALDLLLKAEVEHWIAAARTLLADISRRRSSADQPAASPNTRTTPDVIVHASPAMRDVIQMCDAFADSDEPVLVVGPTGTGKELIARRLHARSRRRRGRLVCVNVSAIPEGVFAREFFGHVRGAFSGAEGGGLGLAAQADGGTLFLDEIGDLPLEQQPQLLRLLQDGTYQAIGDPAERRVDIRLVAATNADLETLVAQGRFRADLYYRLKILELRLPPLSERRQDVVPLLRHFLTEAAGRPVEPGEFFNRASLELMQSYAWPGNVREIAMVARQARVQLASRGTVRVEVVAPGGERRVFTGPQAAVGAAPERPAAGPLARGSILLALAEADGNRAEAARRLGVSRSTLYRRMEKLGIGAKTALG